MYYIVLNEGKYQHELGLYTTLEQASRRLFLMITKNERLDIYEEQTLFVSDFHLKDFAIEHKSEIWIPGYDAESNTLLLIKVR